jgi:hypothetical protein
MTTIHSELPYQNVLFMARTKLSKECCTIYSTYEGICEDECFLHKISFKRNNFCSCLLTFSRDLQIHDLWLGKFPADYENMYELKRFLSVFSSLMNCLFTESNFLTQVIDRVRHLSKTTIKAASNCQCQFLKWTRINYHFLEKLVRYIYTCQM